MRMYKKLILILILLSITSIGCIKIEPGSIGVLTNNLWHRGVQPKPIETGFRFIIPVAQQIDVYNIRERKYEMTKINEEGEKKGRDDIEFKTNDGQMVYCDATIIYSLIKDLVPILHQSVGQDYIAQTLRPTLRSSIRNYLGKYTAEEIYKGDVRLKVQDELKDAINKALNPLGIVINSVLFRSFEFSQAFEDKIEQKALSTQDVEINKKKVLAAEEYAKQVEAEARGKKLAVLQEAQGISEKKKIEADATRYEQEQNAKGILAIALAEAEGKAKLAEALGSGQNVVMLEYAKNIPDKLQIWGIPTGNESVSIMDLGGIFKDMLPKAGITSAGTKAKEKVEKSSTQQSTTKTTETAPETKTQ
jgi:regulator of protease activity HflC (stomatin/prohibitin superfamily)